jgi:hypothetical protein
MHDTYIHICLYADMYTMDLYFVKMTVGCGISNKRKKCTNYAKYTELLREKYYKHFIYSIMDYFYI